MTDDNGQVLNKYTYDPFGRIIQRQEKEPNDYLYVGQWSVRRVKGMKNVYLMQSRLYHAKYGRFLGPDTYGFASKSTNLYTYMGNNPLSGKKLMYVFICL